MSRKRIILLSIAFVLLLGLGWLANLLWFRPFNINHFYTRTFAKMAWQDPELLTQLRMAEKLGFYRHNSQWTDATPLHQVDELMRFKEALAMLERYDRDRLSPADQLSYDVIHNFFQGQVAGEAFLFHDFPVNQLFGVHLDMPQLLTQDHQVNSRRDGEYYLSRLRLTEVKINQTLEDLKFREEMKGVVPPKIIVELVRTQLAQALAVPVRQHVLYQDLRSKLDSVPELEQRVKDGILREAIRHFNWRLYPAYRRLDTYFAHLDSIAPEEVGAWYLPDGEAYYAHQLRQMTTTDLSADEIHEIGLAEVSRISGEMNAILVGQGYADTVQVGRVMAELAQDSSFLYPNTLAGKEACLQDYRKLVAEMSEKLPEAFDFANQRPVEVQPVPAFQEANTPAAYYSPGTLDGSRPGTFYANLRDMSEVPRFGMKTLTYHEAIPGHHFQFVAQLESEDLPLVRRLLPVVAFSEGWGLYAEQLAWEMGLYEGDPYGNLGRLQAELFRAVRLVVDTGIHQKRWSREQAITYLYQMTGLPKEDVITEVDRYIVMPGQACAYKIGQLKLLELRQQAQESLGESFDLKAFHRLILTQGSLPLQLLERVVMDWVAEQQAV